MRNWIYILFAVVLITGCEFDNKDNPDHSAIGEIGEVMIFSDHLTMSKSDQLIDSVWGRKIISMNDEPAFKVRKSEIKEFSGYTEKNYNIFMLVHKDNWMKIKALLPLKAANAVEKSFENGNYNFRIKDVFVQPQMVYFVVANNLEELQSKLRAGKDGLLEQARFQERNTTIASLIRTKPEYDDFFNNMMKKEGYAIRRPDFYTKKVEGDGFYGISRYIGESHMGVYMYSEPYTTDFQFDTSYILRLRDSVLQKFIKGPDRVDGKKTYMKTYYTPLRPIEYRQFELNGHYVIEVRGWWEMANEYMGGPFVSYTIHSQNLNRIVTLEGNAFAPNRESKRRLVRELELIMSTFADSK